MRKQEHEKEQEQEQEQEGSLNKSRMSRNIRVTEAATEFHVL